MKFATDVWGPTLAPDKVPATVITAMAFAALDAVVLRAMKSAPRRKSGSGIAKGKEVAAVSSGAVRKVAVWFLCKYWHNEPTRPVKAAATSVGEDVRLAHQDAGRAIATLVAAGLIVQVDRGKAGATPKDQEAASYRVDRLHAAVVADGEAHARSPQAPQAEPVATELVEDEAPGTSPTTSRATAYRQQLLARYGEDTKPGDYMRARAIDPEEVIRLLTDDEVAELEAAHDQPHGSALRGWYMEERKLGKAKPQVPAASPWPAVAVSPAVVEDVHLVEDETGDEEAEDHPLGDGGEADAWRRVS